MNIIIVGNPVDGFAFYGPYETVDEAVEAAEGLPDTWCLAVLEQFDDDQVSADSEPDKDYSGYHQFVNDEGEQHGSFEVFHHDGITVSESFSKDFPDKGWYWWACFPGCLPDGDPTGPFPTAEGAYLDAIGD